MIETKENLYTKMSMLKDKKRQRSAGERRCKENMAQVYRRSVQKDPQFKGSDKGLVTEQQTGIL